MGRIDNVEKCPKEMLGSMVLFGMAAMPFLSRDPFSPKLSYHRNASLAVYLPIKCANSTVTKINLHENIFQSFPNKKNLSCYTNSIWPHSAWTNQARWAQTKILFIQLGHSASWVKAWAQSNSSLLWIIIHLKKILSHHLQKYKNIKNEKTVIEN